MTCKKPRAFHVFAILCSALLYILAIHARAESKLGDVLVLRGDGATVRLSVEFAMDSTSHARGLMGRTELAPRQGMLFDFGQPSPVTMWMKETFLSLDMIFADRHGVIVSIARHTTPESLDLIRGGDAVRYVLEINAGEAQSLGIATGDRFLVRPPET